MLALSCDMLDNWIFQLSSHAWTSQMFIQSLINSTHKISTFIHRPSENWASKRNTLAPHTKNRFVSRSKMLKLVKRSKVTLKSKHSRSARWKRDAKRRRRKRLMMLLVTSNASKIIPRECSMMCCNFSRQPRW